MPSSSCGFQPTDTLAQVCKDHNILDVPEVIRTIQDDDLLTNSASMGQRLAHGLEDITSLPKITQWLVEKGYTDQQIANIWGGNVLRVVEEAQRVAKTLQASSPP